MDTVSQFQHRLDTLLEGIQVIDFDWRYVYLNGVMVEQSHASREELLGHTMMEAYPGIEHTDVFGYIKRCMNERLSFRIENQFVYPDGSSRWFDLQIEPDPQGVCILSLDITDYKHAQNEIFSSEKRFRALIEKSADMKTMATADGRLIYGSPSITKLLGYTLGQMQHKVIFDLFHPDDLPGFIKQRQKILTKPGGSFNFQLRVRHKNGEYIWCDGTVTNFLDEPGINAVVSNFTDISEKKKTEQQREFDQNNLYALINNSTDLMWSVGRDYKLITSNTPYDESIKAIRGFDIHSGDDVLAGTPDYIRRWLIANYKRAFSGEIFTETVYNPGAGGWFEVSFHPIRKGDQVIGTACHSRDITAQKINEQQLLRNNAELQKTNLELDRFVYSISHDLRSPLTSILGLLSLIEEDTREEETRDHAKMIRKAINRLDVYIKNVLSYSRNNRTGLNVEEIPLCETVNEVIESLCAMREADGIEFIVDFDPSQTFRTDRHSFCTILENLISNAIKFHRKDLKDKHIRIGGNFDGDVLRLSVSDNGIGIAAEYHEKIFDMFFRLSGSVDGSGIGLYIVKEIVDKLGGSIGVTSIEGSGTSFHLQLKNLEP